MNGNFPTIPFSAYLYLNLFEHQLPLSIFLLFDGCNLSMYEVGDGNGEQKQEKK